jgi:hypothetical protein
MSDGKDKINKLMIAIETDDYKYLYKQTLKEIKMIKLAKGWPCQSKYTEKLI